MNWPISTSLTAIAVCLSMVPAAVPASPAATEAEKADPLFDQPYIDIDEWRTSPVPHRHVHGGFRGTDLRFSYYLPPKARYGGRFYQYVTPVPDSETLSQGLTGEEDRIGAAIAAGAYFVETNGGGASANAGPAFHADPTIGGFRANAAAARFSRTVATKMYGGGRPFGYLYGGSGGAYRTLGGIEGMPGVWDGAVPYVLGSTMATPYNFTVRMHAMRVLRDRFPSIVDALEPGGSGDPYAGLNAEEAAALREATRMGFPPQSWFGWKTMGVHAFTALYPGIVAADPGYFTDFWSKPGYLGFDPPASLKRARLRFDTVITRSLTVEEATARGIGGVAIPGTGRGSADLAWQAQVGAGRGRPAAFELAAPPPDVGFLGGDLVMLSGAASGSRVPLRAIAGKVVTLGVADVAVLAKIRPGDRARVDNSNFLAAQTYHRHQVPGREFTAWDQFRGPDGKPLYPQRPLLLGPIFTKGAAGILPSGRFNGKMILVESLWDREAFPWQADWYRRLVSAHLGSATDDRFRVWMTDHALHGDSSRQEDPDRTVSYLGVLQRALRDLSAWVEKGVTPPASTRYRIADGQVVVPADARERRGIQPVVTLRVAGRDHVAVASGRPVRFAATITTPPGAGRVVAAAWDFDGSGRFAQNVSIATPRTVVKVATAHIFTRPGTYFAVLRAVSQREDDMSMPFGRIQNLARVRVTVR